MEIAEFLLACFAEDQEQARNASRVRETRTGDSWTVTRGRYGLDKVTRPGGDVGEVLVEAARHIARHDPARVLAECDAKRQIVELHREELIERLDDEFPGTPYDALCVVDNDDFPCTTLRLLALPYADHPDYREEWKP